jgi:Flp pilus assembly protein TadD
MVTIRPLHPLCDRQLVVVCLVLFGLVVWTFLPALHNGFINYDDDIYVTGNAHVKGGLNPASVVWAFTSVDASNWHPLTWLSHLTDFELYGLNPDGHHFTSILLHAINTVLVFLWLRRMTGADWRSLFVAAIFGLHPLRVESVAWISERKDVLSTLFGLLALMAYTRHARSVTSDKWQVASDKSAATTPDALHPSLYYVLALVFFAFSLMSKPMLVTLPFLLLLLDYWPLRRVAGDKWQVTCGKLVIEKIPFFVLSAASCAVTYLAQKQGGAMVLMAGQPFPARVENALVSYGRYLGKLFWPENLAVVYPVVDHWRLQVVLLVTALLLAVSATAIILRRLHPYLMTGWFWFLGTLVPVLGLVAVGEQAMADRYTYFPLIGVLLIVAWAVEELTRRWYYQPFALPAMSVAIIVTCIVLTRQNVAYWKSSETLFRHVIAVTKDNYSAHCNLANALFSQGDLEGTLTEYQEALKLKPESFENESNVGMALAYLNRMDEAILAFQKALKLNPGFGMGHQNLGAALEAKDRLEDAIREYEEAIRLMPNYAPAHNSLGVAYAKQNRLNEALDQFEAAVKLDPSFVPAQNNLKMALQLKGK